MDDLFKEFTDDNPSQCIHSEFQTLTDKITEAINKEVPLIKLSKNKTRLKLKPWLSKGLLKSAKVKNKMFKKLIKTNFNNQILTDKYKKYRNKLTHLISIAKKQHYDKLLTNSNDPKNTWKIINKVIGKNKKATTLPDKLKYNNTTQTDPQLIANSLNKYFSEIGKSNYDHIDYNQINNNISHKITNSLLLYNTTPEEISLVIKNMKNKNSLGPDQIPMCVLKQINSQVSQVLSYLINKSIQTGIYPNCLKIAKVIPLFKGGSPNEPGNYRLISLLPSINKIFEQLIYI